MLESKRFDGELKRSDPISDAPGENCTLQCISGLISYCFPDNEDLEIGSVDLDSDDDDRRDKRFEIYKKFDPFVKKFDPYQKRFDIYKKFDPMDKRFDVYKRFDPLQKRFDVYKRFDPFQKRFDLYKRFDPFSKRFDPLYKRFDPFFKRFDPYMKKRFDREEAVRSLLRSLGQSKRNIIDPRAFNIGFGR